MGRKLKQNEHKASIYFRLRDEDNWLIIDRLMTLPEYERNRAKLLNDALSIGLPLLLEEKENGKITLPAVNEDSVPIRIRRRKGSVADDKEIKGLLSEIVMNSSLNKSMLSALFNLKEKEISNPILAGRFKHGELNNIPDCLFDTQIDMLKEISKDEENE